MRLYKFEHGRPTSWGKVFSGPHSVTPAPSEQEQRDAGYHWRVVWTPSPPTGHYAETWDVDHEEGVLTRVWVEVDPAPFRIEKLALRTALRKAGLEDAFEAALAASPEDKRDYHDAQYIMSDDERIANFVAAIGLKPEQAAALLESARGES